jgi:hypothetical protein
MSHTEILDKIRQRFVNLPSAGLGAASFLEVAAIRVNHTMKIARKATSIARLS